MFEGSSHQNFIFRVRTQTCQFAVNLCCTVARERIEETRRSGRSGQNQCLQRKEIGLSDTSRCVF